jgi:Fibronectin type III domain
MAINFPDSPNNGDSFTSNNKTWVFDGTVWNITSGTNSVADGAITTAKIASNAVHQTKLASNLSAITVTTTANRGTDVASPFTGQTIYLSDVKRLQVWDGSAWMFITNGAPGAPTALSATPLSTTSVSISFTTGTINGASPTNYKYAYSSNGGSTYTEFAALDPADVASPVVISGLTGGTTYLIKLRAVSDFGDSVDSSAVTVTTLTAPAAPTSLSAIGGATSVGISFTAGADGGSALTNYEYALSTNSGATYGSWTALSPADAISPIVISGLSASTAYYIKLRAVSAAGVGTESSAVSISTTNSATINYLVVAGGGGGGGGAQSPGGGGGGAGGLRSSVTASGGTPGTAESAGTATVGNNYAVVVGSGGAGGIGDDGGGYVAPVNGVDSSLTLAGGTITSVGGGKGGVYSGKAAGSGGSGGGGPFTGNGGAGTANQGFAGGNNSGVGSQHGAGGGGASAVGANAANDTSGGFGGAGRAILITGSSVTYAGGGAGGAGYQGDVQTNIFFLGGAGGGGNGGTNTVGNLNGVSGTTNTGGGGGGAGGSGNNANTVATAGNGGSGVVILRYPIANTITVGAGLTSSHTTDGLFKVTTITAGSGNVSWS